MAAGMAALALVLASTNADGLLSMDPACLAVSLSRMIVVTTEFW